MRACIALADRAATSNSVSRSRNCCEVLIAGGRVLAASFSNSASIVGRRSAFRLARNSRLGFALI